MRARVLFVSLLATATGVADSSLDDFGWLVELAGSCWSGTFPDGETVHSHCYTTQFDRFVRGTASLSGTHDGKQVVRFSGDSVFAWDATNKRIVYYIWGSDGSHGRHEAYYEGEDLYFPVRSTRDPGRIAFRSVWHRIDPDSFTVRREVPAGQGWRSELEVLYRRQHSPSPSGSL